MKKAFLSSNSTVNGPSSLGRIFLRSDAGFFGRINEALSSACASLLWYLTSLCASEATKVILSVEASTKMPPITGLSSSSAVANSVLLMPASITSALIPNVNFFSFLIAGRAGKSTPFWPIILNLPFSEVITTAMVSALMSKVRG